MQNSNTPTLNPYQQAQPHDEIDLMELFFALKKHALLIITTTLIFSCLAVIYAISITPTFQAEAIITEPKLAEINKIDNGINLINLTPEQTLKRFHQTLINQDLQYKFFTENLYDASPANPVSPQSAYESFKNSLIIKLSNKNKSRYNFIEVNYQSNNAKDAQATLKNYLELVNQTTLNDINIDYVSTINSQTSKLENTIKQKIDAIKLDTEGEIARLSEAAYIARSLNIDGSSSTTALNNLSLNTELNSHSLPLYTLGYKAIETRIQLLKSRTNLSSFSPDIAGLQAELNTLKSISLNTDKVSTYTFEKTPLIPHAPIKPKKVLIAILGTLLGAMLGCLIALIKYFTNKRSESLKNIESHPLKDIEETKEAISYLNSIPKPSKKTSPTK